ncbi:hypothetical protein CTAYLR_000792 [Chrysophaeum taylorii]|uniref:tRNA/rRNA methyltransferase SpoU type domain-containing protein n=1 Tax=Chrysophaeum taylorii TaxID=2483200 RepID=A0AAD7XNQ6_9STRA|nr:hypothetical protein CTAYLR_000792 [Chrysophaeum taylorii]
MSCESVEGVTAVTASDPRVAIYRNMKGRDVASRGELFILEGENSIQNLVRHGRIPLVSVCVSERRVGPMAPLLRSVLASGVPVYALPQDDLEEIVGFNFHRGVLGCGRKLPFLEPFEFVEAISRDDPRVIIIGEKLNNLDNIGSVFRNAAAFGASAVLLDAQSSDPYYRKSIRVSGGHALVVPFSRAGTIDECVAAVKAHGFKVVALVTPHSDRHPPRSIVDYWRAAHAVPRVALLLGAEGPGLSQQAVDLADAVVTIPMARRVDSINVATACAVALYELTAMRAPRPPVPRGACAAKPVQYELSPAEIESLKASQEPRNPASGEIPGFPERLWFRNDEDDSQDGHDEISDKELDMDEEDWKDVRLGVNDSIFLVGRAEEDGSCVEMHVFDASAGSLYVHHDIALPAFPLALEWLSLPGMASTSFVAVGTMLASVEVWNLDVLDPLEPTLALGSADENDDGGNDDGAVLSLAWNRTAVDCLASGSADAALTLWDLAAQRVARVWSHHSGRVQGLAWHACEVSVLASGGDDSKLAVCDCRAADAVLGVDLASQIQAVVWQTPARVLAACDDGAVSCFDPRKFGKRASPLWRLQAHAKSCQGVVVNDIGQMATASLDKSVKLWDLGSPVPHLAKSKTMAAGRLFDVCFDEHAPHLLAAAGSTGALALWDTSADDDDVVAGSTT